MCFLVCRCHGVVQGIIKWLGAFGLEIISEDDVSKYLIFSVFLMYKIVAA